MMVIRKLETSHECSLSCSTTMYNIINVKNKIKCEIKKKTKKRQTILILLSKSSHIFKFLKVIHHILF